MASDNNFMKAIEFTLPWEAGRDKNGKIREDGGYVIHPDDPGGETKWGISKKAHPHLDIKNLTMPEAIEIYREEYWYGNHCDEIEMPKALVVFDTYVMQSYATAKMLTRGECTWSDIVKRRKDFRGERVAKHPPSQAFLAGWLNRDNDLHKFCTIWEQDHN